MRRIIVFLDLVGSSSLWAKHADVMPRVLDEIFEIVSDASARTGGKLIKTIGDAFMIVFDARRPGAAVELFIQIHQAFKTRRAPGNLDKFPFFRMGAAWGIVYEKRWVIQDCTSLDYFGNIVNTASRMESTVAPVNGLAFALTEPGQAERLTRYVEGVNAEIIHFTNDHCDTISEIKRSVRTIPYSLQMTQGEKLKGIHTPCYGALVIKI